MVVHILQPLPLPCYSVPMSQLPKYFDVDDLLVKVDFVPGTEEVTGTTPTGEQYPPLKALAEGVEIDEAEYQRRLSEDK